MHFKREYDKPKKSTLLKFLVSLAIIIVAIPTVWAGVLLCVSVCSVPPRMTVLEGKLDAMNQTLLQLKWQIYKDNQPVGYYTTNQMMNLE